MSLGSSFLFSTPVYQDLTIRPAELQQYLPERIVREAVIMAITAWANGPTCFASGAVLGTLDDSHLIFIKPLGIPCPDEDP